VPSVFTVINYVTALAATLTFSAVLAPILTVAFPAVHTYIITLAFPAALAALAAITDDASIVDTTASLTVIVTLAA
jgi:hypothetical protein